MESITAIFSGVLFLLILLLIVLIIGYVFWVWMFIDALTRRDTLWIALFIISFLTGFLPGIMASVYYYTVYKKERGQIVGNNKIN